MEAGRRYSNLIPIYENSFQKKKSLSYPFNAPEPGHDFSSKQLETGPGFRKLGMGWQHHPRCNHISDHTGKSLSTSSGGKQTFPKPAGFHWRKVSRRFTQLLVERDLNDSNRNNSFGTLYTISIWVLWKQTAGGHGFEVKWLSHICVAVILLAHFCTSTWRRLS